MKGVQMKTTINPFKWLHYSKMLSEVDKSVRFVYGDINSSNVVIAASSALEALGREAKARNLTSEEFAYILYSMTEEYVAYQALFSLEISYGRIPTLEREQIADKVAELHYKIADGLFVDKSEYAKIYRPTYQRLNLLMSL